MRKLFLIVVLAGIVIGCSGCETFKKFATGMNQLNFPDEIYLRAGLGDNIKPTPVAE